MPTKQLDRLLFAQGGVCFFCRKPLPKAEASVEHLVASAKGGASRGGLCRTGIVAARILIELGEVSEKALFRVCRARSRTVENRPQEAYVRGLVEVQGIS